MRRFIFVLLLLSTCVAVAQIDQPISELDKLRTVYQKNLAYLGADYSNKVQQLNQRYVLALDDLIKKVTKAGDLDGALAVKAEKEGILANAVQTQEQANPIPSVVESANAAETVQEATAGVWAGDKGQADKLALTDRSPKGLFSFEYIKDSPPKINSAIAKNDYFTTKFRQGYVTASYRIKRMKDVLNVDAYASVSVDVRVREKSDADSSRICINFWQIGGTGGNEIWNVEVPRSLIPADGKTYRMIIPLTAFSARGNPPPSDKSKTVTFDFGVTSPTEHSTLITDVGNVILWKTPVDEVKIETLEK